MTPVEALFVACLVSGVVVPFPEDVPLLLAGVAVGRGEMALPAAAAVGIVATFCRDAGFFAAGRYAGPRFHALLARILGPRLARATARFQGRSRSRQDAVVFLTRFAAGMRGPLYLVAGLLGVPPRRFAVLDLIGLALHVPLVLWIGMTYGQAAATALEGILSDQRPVLLALGLIGLIVWGRRRQLRRRRVYAQAQARPVEPAPGTTA